MIRFSIHTIYFLFLWLAFSSPYILQAETVQPETSVDEPAEITVRMPTGNWQSIYLQDDDFNYGQVKKAPVSIWQKMWMWFVEHVLRYIFNGHVGTILKYVFIIAFVVGLFFLILTLFKSDVQHFFYGKNPSVQVEITDNENIHTISFDDEIQNALLNKNYKLALRLQYLHILKLLTLQNLINWTIHKTNYDYLSELKTSGFYPVFKNVTSHFEYYWYGNEPLHEAGYKLLASEFKSFTREITGTENYDHKN